MAWSAAVPQARIYWLEFTGLHSANADGSDAKTLAPLSDGLGWAADGSLIS